jgi:hypothetical protein
LVRGRELGAELESVATITIISYFLLFYELLLHLSQWHEKQPLISLILTPVARVWRMLYEHVVKASRLGRFLFIGKVTMVSRFVKALLFVFKRVLS